MSKQRPIATKKNIRARLTAATAFSLAKDLAGCVPGPTDLSVSKAYLRGFGMLTSKTSVTKALLHERARDKKREEAKLKEQALS